MGFASYRLLEGFSWRINLATACFPLPKTKENESSSNRHPAAQNQKSAKTLLCRQLTLRICTPPSQRFLVQVLILLSVSGILLWRSASTTSVERLELHLESLFCLPIPQDFNQPSVGRYHPPSSGLVSLLRPSLFSFLSRTVSPVIMGVYDHPAVLPTYSVWQALQLQFFVAPPSHCWPRERARTDVSIESGPLQEQKCSMQHTLHILVKNVQNTSNFALGGRALA